MVGWGTQVLIISIIDEYGLTPGRVTGINIFPPITNQPGLLEIKAVFARSLQYQTGLGFPTIACYDPIVITGINLLQGQLFHNRLMQLLYYRHILKSPAHVRLIRDTEKLKTGRMQLPGNSMDTGHPGEFANASGRERVATPHQRLIYHPIPIEKNCSSQ
jgi:hypothetical protein